MKAIVHLFHRDGGYIRRKCAVQRQCHALQRDAGIASEPCHLAESMHSRVRPPSAMDANFLPCQPVDSALNLRLYAPLPNLILETAKIGPVILQRNFEAAHNWEGIQVFR